MNIERELNFFINGKKKTNKTITINIEDCTDIT